MSYSSSFDDWGASDAGTPQADTQVNDGAAVVASPGRSDDTTGQGSSTSDGGSGTGTPAVANDRSWALDATPSAGGKQWDPASTGSGANLNAANPGTASTDPPTGGATGKAAENPPGNDSGSHSNNGTGDGAGSDSTDHSGVTPVTSQAPQADGSVKVSAPAGSPAVDDLEANDPEATHQRMLADQLAGQVYGPMQGGRFFWKPGEKENGLQTAVADGELSEEEAAGLRDEARRQDQQYNALLSAMQGNKAYGLNDEGQIYYPRGGVERAMRQAWQDGLIEEPTNKQRQGAKESDWTEQSRQQAQVGGRLYHITPGQQIEYPDGRTEEAMAQAVRDGVVENPPPWIWQAAAEADWRAQSVMASRAGQKPYRVETNGTVTLSQTQPLTSMTEAVRDGVLKNPDEKTWTMLQGMEDAMQAATKGLGMPVEARPPPTAKDRAQALSDAHLGMKLYHFDDAGNLQFSDARPLDSLVEAARDGVLTSPPTAEVWEAMALKQKMVQAAGSNAELKALVYGLGHGAAFAATAPIGRALAGLAGLPTGFGAAALATAGATATGMAGAATYDELMHLLAKHSETINSFVQAQELHKNYAMTGDFVANALGLSRSVMKFVGVKAGPLADFFAERSAVAGKTAAEVEQALAAAKAARLSGFAPSVQADALAQASRLINAVGQSYAESGGGVVHSVQQFANLAKAASSQGATRAAIGATIAKQVGTQAAGSMTMDALMRAVFGGQLPKPVDSLTAGVLGALHAGHALGPRSYSSDEVGDIALRGYAHMATGTDPSQTVDMARLRATPGIGEGVTERMTQPLSPAEQEVFKLFHSQATEGMKSGKLAPDPSQWQARAQQVLAGNRPTGVVQVEVGPRGTGSGEDAGKSPALPGSGGTILPAGVGTSSEAPVTKGASPATRGSGETTGTGDTTKALPAENGLTPKLANNPPENRLKPGNSAPGNPVKDSTVPGRPISGEAPGPLRTSAGPSVTSAGASASPVTPGAGGPPGAGGDTTSPGWGDLTPEHRGQPVETQDGRRGALRAVGEKNVALQNGAEKIQLAPRAETRLTRSSEPPGTVVSPASTGGPLEGGLALASQPLALTSPKSGAPNPIRELRPAPGWGKLTKEDRGRPVETQDGRRGMLRAVGERNVALQDGTTKMQLAPLVQARLARTESQAGPLARAVGQRDFSRLGDGGIPSPGAGAVQIVHEMSPEPEEPGGSGEPSVPAEPANGPVRPFADPANEGWGKFGAEDVGKMVEGLDGRTGILQTVRPPMATDIHGNPMGTPLRLHVPGRQLPPRAKEPPPTSAEIGLRIAIRQERDEIAGEFHRLGIETIDNPWLNIQHRADREGFMTANLSPKRMFGKAMAKGRENTEARMAVAQTGYREEYVHGIRDLVLLQQWLARGGMRSGEDFAEFQHRQNEAIIKDVTHNIKDVPAQQKAMATLLKYYGGGFAQMTEPDLWTEIQKEGSEERTKVITEGIRELAQFAVYGKNSETGHLEHLDTAAHAERRAFFKSQLRQVKDGMYGRLLKQALAQTIQGIRNPWPLRDRRPRS